MTFPTDNSAFRRPTTPQPKSKEVTNKAVTSAQTASGATQAEQVLNKPPVPNNQLPDLFMGFHPDMAQQFMIGDCVVREPMICFPADNFDVAAMVNLASKMAGKDGQLLKEEVQAYLANNLLPFEQSRMANFLLNNFEAIQQKLSAMIFVPPGVAIMMAPGFRPEDLKKIAALDGNSKTIGIADMKAPVPPPEESYSTSSILALAKNLAGADGRLTREELEKFTKGNRNWGQDLTMATFLLKNFDAIQRKINQMNPLPPGVDIMMLPGIGLKDLEKLAALDGNPDKLGTADLKAEIQPPIDPPSKDTFDTNEIIRFAASVAGADGRLTQQELEGLFWPSVMDPKVIQGQRMQRFLLDNFQAILGKINQLKPITPGMLMPGISPNDLRLLAGLDGNAKTLGIADLKVTIPNNRDTFDTDELIRFAAGVAGADGRLTREELKNIMGTMGPESFKRDAMKNFLLNNFDEILSKINQLKPITPGMLMPGISPNDLRLLAGLDGNAKTLGIADLKVTIPNNRDTFDTDEIIRFAASVAGADGRLTREELARLAWPSVMDPKVIQGQRMQRFLLDNFQAIQEKLMSLNPLPPGTRGLSLAPGINPKDLAKLAALDGNAKTFGIADLRATVPNNRDTFDTDEIIRFAISAAGQDGVLTRNELQNIMGTMGPESFKRDAMKNFLLNNFQSIQEKLISLNPLPPGVMISLPIGINPKDLAKLAALDGNSKTFGIADLRAPSPTSVSTDRVLDVIKQAGGRDGTLSRVELEQYLKNLGFQTDTQVAKFLLNNFQSILDKLTQLDKDAGIVNVRARNEITAKDIQRLVGNDGNKGNLSLSDIKIIVPLDPPPNGGQSATVGSVLNLVKVAGGKDGVMTLEEMQKYFVNLKPSRELQQAREFIQNNYKALLAKAAELGLSTKSPNGQEGLTAEMVNAIAKLDVNPGEISVSDLKIDVKPPVTGKFSFPSSLVLRLLNRLDKMDKKDGNVKKETIEAFLKTARRGSQEEALARVLLENFTALSTKTFSGVGANLPELNPTLKENVFISLERFRTIMSKPGDTPDKAKTFDNSDLVGVEQQVFPPPPSLPGPVIIDDRQDDLLRGIPEQGPSV